MSQRCVPILLLNMGSEMIYILEQRLKTLQNVGMEKSNKVLQDITFTMLNAKFLDELFKAQDLHSRKTMRHFFEKLAHSSIMRLNESSMDKLYDLITMTVKYQIQTIAMPEQVLTVTINHLDGLRDLMPNDKELMPLLDNAHAMLMSTYRNCHPWEFQMIRCCLLTFFQETRVKVSILLREKKQLESGHFVLNTSGDGQIDIAKDTEPPGTIRYYENGAMVRVTRFPAPDNYNVLPEKENYTLGEMASRSTLLGLNMYRGGGNAIEVKGGGTLSSKQPAASEVLPDGGDLKLLMDMLGPRDGKKSSPGDFDLSLFSDQAEESKFIKESEQNVKRINAALGRKSLKQTMQEMEVKDAPAENSKKKKTRGQEMAEMLDEVASRPETAKKRSSSTKAPKERSVSAARERPASAARASRGNTAENPGSRPITSSKPGTASGRPSSKGGTADRPASKGADRPSSKAGTTAKNAGASRPTTPSKPTPASRATTPARGREPSTKGPDNYQQTRCSCLDLRRQLSWIRRQI
ncbi:unnamed protein product, partial [Mesorhabditis spiculigera]